jgi:tRNA (mo5U34)-methyltransferase
MDIGTLDERLPACRQRMAAARQAIGPGIPWYPYDILASVSQLNGLLHGDNRDLNRLAGGLPVADIGGADGDLAFVLEQECGWPMHLIDTAPTNMNGLRAARALREYLGSSVEIHDVDLDSQFALPAQRYGLVFLLGILYHLQNPYYVLRELSRRTNYLLLSTKVARFAGDARLPIADLPVAYLVGPTETNNDPTNYWMFSPAGLTRIVERAGWTVLDQTSYGDTHDSDPSSPGHDERSFLLLRSHHADSPAAAATAGATARASDHLHRPGADTLALAREPARSRVWPPEPPATPGLDWRESEQVTLLCDHLARQSELVFPDEDTGEPHEYHTGNERFSAVDAWMLQAIVRHFTPTRVIDVGGGWSSLVTARVNREYLGGAIDFTCIDPTPPELLQGGVDGISRIIERHVQEIAIDTFLALRDGDILFIDSSHTVTTGGDVTFLVQEVLPRLAPGVVVHFHDVFLPMDYPMDWVLSGRAWNEQYLIGAFLAFNSAFRILLSVGWLGAYRGDLLAEVLPGYPEGYGLGSSLWIRRDRAGHAV